jgi:hypothetical protein
MGDVYRMQAEILKGKCYFREISMSGMIILRRILTLMELRFNDKGL